MKFGHPKARTEEKPNLFIIGLKTFAWFSDVMDWVVDFHETKDGVELRIDFSLKNRDSKTLCLARWIGVRLADLPLDATEMLLHVDDPDHDAFVEGLDFRPGCRRITEALTKSNE